MYLSSFYLLNVVASTEITSNETTEKISNLKKIWQTIDWDKFISLTLSKGFSLILALFIIGVIMRVGIRLIKKGFANYKKRDIYSASRVDTLEKLTTNAYQYTLYFVLLYTILSIFGVPVASLIAGAGIAGIAIGLGAQGFINDLLTGFFIILERQIDVGDHVIIGEIEGFVQSVGLRTTQVKGADGTLHYIPNGQITIVSNLSRENMLALIKLRIKPDTDVQKVSDIISEVNEKLLPRYPEIKEGPLNKGLVDLGNGNFAIKIIIYTLNGSQFTVQADFLEAYLEALTEAGIELPQSPLPLTPI